MSNKKKKDIFKLSSESNAEMDLISEKFGEMELLIQKQVAVSNNHLQLFEETLSSLSKDYTEIKELKKRVSILTWCLCCVGVVCFSILAIILYFILPFIF